MTVAKTGRIRSVRVLVLAMATLVLTACQVDIRIDVTADDTGAGVVQVTVDVDPEAVVMIPGLAADLRYDDLIAGGWTIEGPFPVNNGGLRAILRYPFESPAEATAALGQISGPNGPLIDPQLKRTIDGRLVSTTLDATLQFTGGLNTFSDLALTSAIGGPPWTQAAQKLGVSDPMNSVTVTLVARLPGKVKKTTGTEAEGAVVWTSPTDGTAQPVVVGAVSERIDGGFWPVLARASGTLLGYWLIIVGVGILLGVLIRNRRPRPGNGRIRPPRDRTGPQNRGPRGPRDGRPRLDPTDPRRPRPPLSDTGPAVRRPAPPADPGWHTTPDF